MGLTDVSLGPSHYPAEACYDFLSLKKKSKILLIFRIEIVNACSKCTMNQREFCMYLVTMP